MTQPIQEPTEEGHYYATRIKDGQRWFVRVGVSFGKKWVLYPLGSATVDEFKDYIGPFRDTLATEPQR